MTKQEKYAKMFEEKAKALYEDKYDYSKAEYTRARDKVIIICPEHGEFTKTPNKHLSGQGCPDCSNSALGMAKMKPFTEFVEEANALHNNQYTYIENTYKGAKPQMKMICLAHGTFEQTPDKHINSKQGCPDCGFLKISTRQLKSQHTFIQEAVKVHEGKYTYDSTNYQGSHTNIIITCPVHGVFEQTPSNHLAGKGCKKCTLAGGYDASKAGKVYYISIDNGKYYKIGITNRTVWQRFSKDEHDRIRIVKEWDYPFGRDAQIAETKILRAHRGLLIPSTQKVLRDGNSEIFTKDVLGLDYTEETEIQHESTLQSNSTQPE